MARPTDVLKKFRAICLALPQATETITWGEPHYRVLGKIFAGYGEKGGKVEVGFKLEKDHAAQLIAKDSRFRPADYVGKHGWVAMDALRIDDWDDVRSLVFESFRLIAPKRLLSPRAGRKAPRRGA